LFFQYNIKKKEELPEPVQEEPANPLMRKKKTPEELAKEAEMEEEDEFTSKRNLIYLYMIIYIFTNTQT
jgi:complexin-1/2